MADLTVKQQRIVDFIRLRQEREGVTPTQAEIADHFGYGSRNAVAQHLRLIRQKGQLGEANGKARSIRVLSPLQRFKQRIVDIPVFGSIPAGYGEDRVQEAEGCVSVDVESIGIKPTRNTFALRVTGDSMIGRHILDGDMVVNRLKEFVGQEVTMCGLIIEQRTHHQVTGEPMKFLTLCDWTGMVETELFAATYRSYGLATVRYPVL